MRLLKGIVIVLFFVSEPKLAGHDAETYGVRTSSVVDACRRELLIRT